MYQFSLHACFKGGILFTFPGEIKPFKVDHQSLDDRSFDCNFSANLFTYDCFELRINAVVLFRYRR